MRHPIAFLTGTLAAFAVIYAIHAITLWDAWFVLRMDGMTGTHRFAVALALLGMPPLFGLMASIAASIRRSLAEERELRGSRQPTGILKSSRRGPT